MPRCVISIERGYHIGWSTVVDAPVTKAMNHDEARLWLLKSYSDCQPPMTYWQAEESMLLCERAGASVWWALPLDTFLAFNRAGDNETCITKEEIARQSHEEAQ